MLKSKRELQLEELYKPETIEINNLSHNEENKLTELEKNSKIITVKVSPETFEKKGMFSNPKVTCKIECPELESNVIRGLEDIEWLKNQLIEKYPMTYIPPTPDKKCLKDGQTFSRYVQRFFNAILRRKILRTSTIIQDFLISDEKTFETYKKNLNENVFKLSVNMDNFKSRKESLKYDFKKEQLSVPDKYIKKMDPAKSLYANLDNITVQIANDFVNLHKHMKELSDACGKLNKSAKDTDQNETTKKVFEKLKTVFNDCAASYLKQSEIIEKDFKEFFHYVNLQINEMSIIQNTYIKKRNEFESLGIAYLNKREKLFNEKKYNKWELKKEDEEKLDTFKDNKEEAFKYICKEMGENVEQLKKQVGCFCNMAMKQYNHINKYVGEQIKTFFGELKEKNKDFIEQGFTIGKLINIELD